METKTASPQSGEPLEIKRDLSTDLPATGGELPEHARPGQRCPACGQGILDYDGLLNLKCPVCDFYEGGCFT